MGRLQRRSAERLDYKVAHHWGAGATKWPRCFSKSPVLLPGLILPGELNHHDQNLVTAFMMGSQRGSDLGWRVFYGQFVRARMPLSLRSAVRVSIPMLKDN